MGWYILNCKAGQEQLIINSCRQHLSSFALESVFTFRCERLWRTGGFWRLVEKEMFPGYVFLNSCHPKELSEELKPYRKIVRIMEENGYLISVYEEEESYLNNLCGENHIMKLSYGYKNSDDGDFCITSGPLKEWKSQIVKINWHKRFAQVGIPLTKRKVIVWAGLDLTKETDRGMQPQANNFVS